MIQCQAHEAIIQNLDKLHAWYKAKKKELPLPIYTSVDIRDSGYKIVSVDANIFPAGFNNICGTDQESAPAILDQYLKEHYKREIKKILIVTEEHTNNAYYWENVYALSQIVVNSGREVRVTMPKDLPSSFEMETAFGNKVLVSKAIRKGGDLLVDDDFVPDFILSNNDFSLALEEWNKGLTTIMNPPHGFGWYQRKKSMHFDFYNSLAEEFAGIINMDPWAFQVETQLMQSFNPNDEASKQSLSEKVEAMVERLRTQYHKRSLDVVPTVFVKNNAGTYGLAVTKVESGNEILSWNNRTRTKMKAAKGGREVEEIIIQEGVPTQVKAEEASAEPVIYMLGSQLIGGFLRTHSSKGPTDSLNSPGAIYKRLCVTDLNIQPNKCPLENVYGWVAKLSCLATGMEAKSLGVDFPEYEY